MNSTAIHWLNVAKLLQKRGSVIECPFCHLANLEIWNEKYADGQKMDTYVRCPNCKEGTVYSGVPVSFEIQDRE